MTPQPIIDVLFLEDGAVVTVCGTPVSAKLTAENAMDAAMLLSWSFQFLVYKQRLAGRPN